MKERLHKSRPLVMGYLERISSKVFEDFSAQLTHLIGKQHGVYSLYKGDKLYYVGLATNLKSRIKHHLKDRHASKWDRFSLYLVRKVDHIKELESIILKIADPRGNTQRGRLKHADNLQRNLLDEIRQKQEHQIQVLVGGVKRKGKKTRKNKDGETQPTLAPYINHRFHIRLRHNDNLYIAHVRRDGSIMFARESAEAHRLQGKVFNSPSSAAQAITRHAMDGWKVWYFKNRKGEWIKLDELRK